MMKYFIWVCMLIAFHINSFAQQVIKGRVIDAQTHEPVSGANIRLINTIQTAFTDAGGEFAITASFQADSVLISCTGYISDKLPIAHRLVISLQPAVNSLNEVVVSASREEQSRKTIPLAISKISSQTMRDTRAASLYQLLNKVPGVYMVNLGNEQHTMSIRQPVTYNALYLYLEDGLPIRPTGIFNHNALYEINMNGVRDIEVIKGPASSLYGSNAIGGAVNFISQVPQTAEGERISVQGDGYHYYRADADAGLTAGKLGIYLGGYAAHQQESWQDYTNFDKYSGSIKTVYDFSSATRLTLTGTFNYLDTQTPGSLDSTRFYSRSYGSNQHFTYRRVNALRSSFRIDHTWDERNATFLTFFFRDNSTGQLPSYFISDVRNSSGQYLKSTGQENNQSFNSYGFLLQHRANFNFLRSRFITGIYLDSSPSTYYARLLNISKDIANNYYTGYTNTNFLLDDYSIKLFNTAAYMEYEIHPAESLRLVAGLRYDNVIYNFKNKLPATSAKYKQEEKNNFNIAAPKLGVTYDLGKGIGLYTNFSVGFQPPETSYLYSSRQMTPLKEAVFYNYELGGWLPLFNNKLNLELTAYNMEGKNEIISVLMSDNTTQKQNAGATRHTGLEYSLIWLPSSEWRVRFGGTHSAHRYVEYSEVNSGKTVKYNGNRMINAPRWIANSEITWKPGFIEGFRTSAEWQHIGRYYVNSANSKTYNGFDIFNLRLGYDLRKTVARGAGIWFNVLNLSDELYANTVTGNKYGVTYNAAPPRTFSLGLSYTFFRRSK